MEGEKTIGIFFIIGAYTLWGILPIYWKFLDEVPSSEILAHRIVWSFVFISIIVILRKRKQLKNFFKVQMSQKKTWFALFLTSLLISTNWLTYIFAVNKGHIVDASLGYYINPLVSVLLGVFVLREKINKLQTFSFILAGIGVLYMTISIGKFPWIALILAFSFGFYGLAKKLIKVDSILGLFLETLFAVPFAIIFLSYLGINGQHSFTTGTVQIDWLLMGSGIATALPLLWFGIGAQKIPLYLLGFLQYIAPTISLFLGVLLYDEAFTIDHIITFTCIWIAIVTFTISNIRYPMRNLKISTTRKPNEKMH
ncbi:EamA family transporter RarD [Pallidibacillus thermolactis]|jgi:chloramphenicol-sensitive protein RarD|uniref:EamA family transporter RarD n=1 Tax=Pallidibacillus thermolactis TaxID=251051 RepID=UPI0021DACC91|nr:EamA family transporter RarD [Pallidibacillus thermolactis]MCU9602618.1 EamA family transporter RarD [Pallidibacillus thermolactis subsp. kokeshiiformis]